MRDAEHLIDEIVQQYRREAVKKVGNEIIIDYQKLPSTDASGTILFELLREYGFNGDQVKSIVHSVHGESGRLFYSETHRLIKDRTQFIITDIQTEDINEYFIHESDLNLERPIKLNLKNLHNRTDFKIPGETNYATIDRDKLIFPLVLRKWKKGDRFMPFGMNQFKKLSDFFIDQKLSVADKESIWIIESGNEIVWIIDYRIDNRFRIKPDTINILMLEFIK